MRNRLIGGVSPGSSQVISCFQNHGELFGIHAADQIRRKLCKAWSVRLVLCVIPELISVWCIMELILPNVIRAVQQENMIRNEMKTWQSPLCCMDDITESARLQVTWADKV